MAMECYGGDGVARHELVHGYGDGGAAGARRLLLALRDDEGGAGKLKMGRGMARAGAGGVKATFRHVVAYAIRALVMRGHFPLHAAAMA